MITDSYSASCCIENKDGQYCMECKMNYGDKEIYSSYEGKNFLDGVNFIMDDINAQMLKPEPEPQPEESLEDKVVRLENLVSQLQAKNDDLNDYIDTLESISKKDSNKKQKIDDNIKQFLDEFMDSDDFNKIWDVEKESKNPNELKSEPEGLRWSYNPSVWTWSSLGGK